MALDVCRPNPDVFAMHQDKPIIAAMALNQTSREGVCATGVAFPQLGILLSVFLWLASALALAPTDTSAQGINNVVVDCGNPFENAHGPFDYRTASTSDRRLVEAAHFTSRVEALQGGATGALGGDIGYTLRAFPNHPRALMSMIRLAEREKTARPQSAIYSVECYVERAVLFRPDDMTVRMIRGIFYSKQKAYDKAIEDFKLVLERQPNDSNAHYNIGLAYFELKDYNRASEHASRARSLGFPLEGLRSKLKAVGKAVD